MNASKLIEASAILQQTTALLALDLSLTHNPFLLLNIQFALPRNGNATVVVRADELDAAISSLIAKNLEQLEEFGVDTSEVLQQFKDTAIKIKQGVDTAAPL